VQRGGLTGHRASPFPRAYNTRCREVLAKRAEQVWAQVPALLEQRTARGYDQTVSHPVELRDLAERQGERATFDARLRTLLAPYAGSAALRRLQQHQLAI
jgi:hypothetical protein